MVRILGRNLSNKKKISIALTAIYGIGLARSHFILKTLQIEPTKKIPELSDKNISEIRDFLESEQFKLEGDLKKMVNTNIRRLVEIQSYRGRRHLKGLPVRGQRTRTNNRTSRKLSAYVNYKKK